MERGRLWREVHLYREGPTSGRRVRERRPDTSWEILTQEPGSKTLSQLCRGMQQSRPPLFACYSVHLSGMWARNVVVYVLCNRWLFASLRHPSIHSFILRREALDMLLSNFSLSSLLCIRWGKKERQAPWAHSLGSLWLVGTSDSQPLCPWMQLHRKVEHNNWDPPSG